jgi:hypothetical protein
MGNTNAIQVRAEKPIYTSGEPVRGTIYLSLTSPLDSVKGIFLKITGFERTSWTERLTRTVRDGENTRSETYHEYHTGRREFFKYKVPVYSFQGTLQAGQYEFPFGFMLPDGLPGVFTIQSNHFGDTYSASIQYKIKATCERSGFFKSDVKHTYNLVVQARLLGEIRAASMEGRSDVTQCCCFNKGNCHLVVHMDKNSYVPGETANVVCEIENKSTIKLPAIKVRLYRKIELRFHTSGRLLTDTQVVSQAVYAGVDPNTDFTGDRSRFVPLVLANTGGLQPETHGTLVTCSYWCEVDLDVPWGSDIRVALPVKIYAPQPPPQGYTVLPPNWHAQQMPTVEFSVPGAIAPPPGGYPPQQTYQQPPPQYQQQQQQQQQQYNYPPPNQYQQPGYPPPTGGAPPSSTGPSYGSMK